MTFNPFDPAAPATLAEQRAQEATERQAEARRAATVAALGHPAGRAWLADRLAEETARPSYSPGATFDLVAYREGRKAILRDLAADLAPQPDTPR